MDNKHFVTVAGHAALAAHDSALDAAVPLDGGLRDSDALVRWQSNSDRWVSAQLCKTIYGWGMRYGSGIQNFGIIHSAGKSDGSKTTFAEAAERAAEWVAEDPAHRYVFTYREPESEAWEAGQREGCPNCGGVGLSCYYCGFMTDRNAKWSAMHSANVQAWSGK